MPEIELLSVVALLEDIPDKDLLRGQVGTVVETLAPGVFEVEFSDDNGQTYATRALRADQLMRRTHLEKRCGAPAQWRHGEQRREAAADRGIRGKWDDEAGVLRQARHRGQHAGLLAVETEAETGAGRD